MHDDDEEIDTEVKVCEICGEEGDDIIPCRMCGINFCGECGYPEKNLCFDCADEVDESLQDEVEETLIESSEVPEED
jgi:hypothetical protein